MQQRDIDTIKPYTKNAKKHSNEQIDKIAHSIKKFGFNQPIVVDKEGTIIVGHGRLEAAKILELQTVPVLEVDLSEDKAKAYRLADNKLNESDWDMDLVIEELRGLSDDLVDLTGFDRNLVSSNFEPADNTERLDEKKSTVRDGLTKGHIILFREVKFTDEVQDQNMGVKRDSRQDGVTVNHK